MKALSYSQLGNLTCQPIDSKPKQWRREYAYRNNTQDQQAKQITAENQPYIDLYKMTALEYIEYYQDLTGQNIPMLELQKWELQKEQKERETQAYINKKEIENKKAFFLAEQATNAENLNIAFVHHCKNFSPARITKKTELRALCDIADRLATAKAKAKAKTAGYGKKAGTARITYNNTIRKAILKEAERFGSLPQLIKKYISIDANNNNKEQILIKYNERKAITNKQTITNNIDNHTIPYEEYRQKNLSYNKINEAQLKTIRQQEQLLTNKYKQNRTANLLQFSELIPLLTYNEVLTDKQLDYWDY